MSLLLHQKGVTVKVGWTAESVPIQLQPRLHHLSTKHSAASQCRICHCGWTKSAFADLQRREEDRPAELQPLKSVCPLCTIMMGGDHNTKKTMTGAQGSVWSTPQGRSAWIPD